MFNDEPNIITEVTRKNIIDELILSGISWAGRLEEPDFLARLYNLKKLPSTDYRFSDAGGDIWQHRVNNFDWEEDWVFYDNRFNILNADDAEFLRFLCETVHPMVRNDDGELHKLLQIYNHHLAADGLEIVQHSSLSGRPVYAARRKVVEEITLLEEAKKAATFKGADYVMQQINRMESSINSSPDLAIGTAKEYLETICKTVLDERGISYAKDEDVAGLVRLCLQNLNIVPSYVDDPASARDSLRSLVGSLSGAANRIGNIRNTFGTGHGKGSGHQGLDAHHARLVVNAAITIGLFIFEANNR